MMFEASIVPSAEPAPTIVCSSSMNRMTFLARRISSITALMRSSNWPRYLVPATIRAEVERDDAFVAQHLRDVAGGDFLGQALDDGRLADAGFAEQHRVVLGAAAQDLDDPLDLLLRPMTGSSSPARAASVRSTPSSVDDVGVLLVLPCGVSCAGLADSAATIRTQMTCVRTLSRLTPSDPSTPAAMPSPSRTSPSSRCSVPM